MKQKSILFMIAVAAALLAALANLPLVAALAQNVACYTQQGGANVVAGSGCTYSWRAGSSLKVQGGTASFAGDLTATPYLVINPTTGAKINGAVIGATPGIVCNRGSATFTNTVSYTSTVTALTTPTWSGCAMQAITGDAFGCSAAAGSGIITLTIRNNAATPVTNATLAAVSWEACGTGQ